MSKPKPFRVLITGSRDWNDKEVILKVLAKVASKYPEAVLVHGDARGADRMAAHMWKVLVNGDVEAHPVTDREWSVNGPGAGMMRNRKMVRLGADLCIAFIRNHSNGATMCAETAERAGIPTWRITHDD